MPANRKKFRLVLLPVIMLLSGAAVGWLASERHQVRAQSPQGARVEVSGQGYRNVVRQVMPSVVNISSERTVIAPELRDPFGLFDDPLWRRFDTPRERRERGLGSGVILSADGYIVTNAHVIRNATDIKVILSDQREFKAKVAGVDNPTDLALLKIDAKGLPPMKVGDSSKIEPGDIVLAMGNPFGLSQTVTMGIVSATGRAGLGIEDYEDFIQTDAAINPGNSGGPLVDTNGAMIGINAAILSRSGGSQGVGFAIPSALAMSVVDQLKSKGKMTRGWLGVSIQPVDAAVAKAFGLKEPKGTLIGDVTEGSPASKAGIKRGDVVLELNGQPVPDSRELRMRISLMAPGTKVNLKLIRDGKELTVQAELGELPEDLAAALPSEQREGALEGVTVSELTPEVARQLGLPRAIPGVVVTDVNPASPAGTAGLRRGDVIQEVNRRAVANPRAYRSALAALPPGSPVTLLVNRGGRTLYIIVEPR